MCGPYSLSSRSMAPGPEVACWDVRELDRAWALRHGSCPGLSAHLRSPHAEVTYLGMCGPYSLSSPSLAPGPEVACLSTQGPYILSSPIDVSAHLHPSYMPSALPILLCSLEHSTAIRSGTIAAPHHHCSASLLVKIRSKIYVVNTHTMAAVN